MDQFMLNSLGLNLKVTTKWWLLWLECQNKSMKRTWNGIIWRVLDNSVENMYSSKNTSLDQSLINQKCPINTKAGSNFVMMCSSDKGDDRDHRMDKRKKDGVLRAYGLGKWRIERAEEFNEWRGGGGGGGWGELGWLWKRFGQSSSG